MNLHSLTRNTIIKEEKPSPRDDRHGNFYPRVWTSEQLIMTLVLRQVMLTISTAHYSRQGPGTDELGAGHAQGDEVAFGNDVKGRDVSDFSSILVKNVVAKSVEVKKMVYQYLVHYQKLR